MGIRNLKLDRNCLLSLAGMPSKMTHLQEINLEGNNLTSLDGMPRELDAIQSIYLFNNSNLTKENALLTMPPNNGRVWLNISKLAVDENYRL